MGIWIVTFIQKKQLWILFFVMYQIFLRIKCKKKKSKFSSEFILTYHHPQDTFPCRINSIWNVSIYYTRTETFFRRRLKKIIRYYFCKKGADWRILSCYLVTAKKLPRQVLTSCTRFKIIFISLILGMPICTWLRTILAI